MITTEELQRLLDNKTVHDYHGDLCIESQEEDQTYLMSVQALPNISGTSDVVKELAAEVIRLRTRISELKRFVPFDVVECRGDKCRQPWCASCYGWEDAQAYIAALNQSQETEI